MKEDWNGRLISEVNVFELCYKQTIKQNLSNLPISAT